ncbi:MAG: primosomal protein N' [Thermoanaerobaculia bacterium]
MTEEQQSRPLLVEVAVPLPLAHPLTYKVPAAYRRLAVPGARARVPVGKRRMVGLVLAEVNQPPDGVSVRALESIIDREPVMTPDLLELAAFTSDYYLAPIGEVVRAMLPADLPPWGDRRIWLTDAGALAIPRNEEEQTIIEVLHREGRPRVSELQAHLGDVLLHPTIDRLEGAGWVTLSAGARRGARYQSAVELVPGEIEELMERCGRSIPGREVVKYLRTLGRPATVSETLEAAGCTRAVVRRLVGLGILREFSQIARLPLGHHFLESAATPDITLRPDQTMATEALVAAVRASKHAAFLLAGITGSGKTEVYLRAISTCLELDRSALVLVPEIALVPALARATRERFGDRLAVLHSALSRLERQQEWERIRHGEARVVLGPRSAVFAPVAELGLVIVDEEQDSSYKQDSTPRYNGRDLARLRAHRQGAVVVVVSATPSLESRYQVETGKVGKLELIQRVGYGKPPEGILVDLRTEGVTRRPGEAHFSARLRDELEAALAAGDQAILLRNRRGYAPILLCRACGADMRCADCGLPRTFHRRDNALRCHYCGSAIPTPTACPACEEEALEPIGTGTERVEEEFRNLFAGVSVDVLDRDTVRRRGGLAGVLESFGRGDTQVLIGTQMVSKGHHFPRVALAGVLLADTYLGFPDFRAVERTYSLLTQLAGRAGRGERPGKVVIQTFHPHHYAIQAALTHDDQAFAEEEMRFRRVFHYPPYTRMIQLLVRDGNRTKAEKSMTDLARRLASHPLARGVRITGPAPAPFERLRGKWRFQLLLRAEAGSRLRQLVQAVVSQPSPTDLVIDVDPYELL